MLKIGFVVTPGFPVMSLAALSVFEFANATAGKTLYELALLSEDGGQVPAYAGVNLQTTAFAGTYFDTLIIGGNTCVIPTSPKLLDFVAEVAGNARRLSSICTGAFALADAGLLDGRRVTTHWLFTEEMKSRFPAIKLEANRIFVVDGPFWTAAGNSAGIDLALAMLEQDYGAELALTVARIMVVERQRAGGQPQHSALFDLKAKSDRIQNVLAHARANLRMPLPIESLSEIAGLGVRQFSRAFREETGMSPAKAVESLRLEAARLMIEQSRHPIDVIATETGFGDPERMRRAFVRVLGHSPRMVRRQARENAEA